MSDTFLKLCDDVERATAHIHSLEACHPHYRRVLDYIISHPAERDSMATALSGSLYGKPGSARASIYLLQYLMESLRWPEVRVAAEARLDDGGNHFHDTELKRLLDLYVVS
jgi:hypothetical protein